MRKTLRIIGLCFYWPAYLLSLPVRWIGYGIAFCFRWLRKPWSTLPGSGVIETVYTSTPMRVIRWIVFFLVCVIFWLIAALLLGVLGPIVRTVAPPAAAAAGYRLSMERCVIAPLWNDISIANLSLNTADSPRIGTDKPLISLGLLACKPLNGYVKVEALRVENPDSFTEKHYTENALFSLPLLEADVDMSSLAGEEIVVELIRLHGMRALYAFDHDTTNVDALVAQLVPPKAAEEVTEKVDEQVAEVADEAQAPAAPKKQQDVRLMLVDIEDNAVSIRKGSIPLGTYPLPPLHAENIGTSDIRATYEPIVKGISATIDAVKTGAAAALDGLKNLGSGAKDIFGAGMDSAGKALGSASEGLSGTGKALGDAADAAGEGAKQAIDSLKSLFDK